MRDNAEKPFGNMLASRKPWHDVAEWDATGDGDDKEVQIKSKYQEKISANFKRQQRAKKASRLLELEYSSIFEYMVLLHIVGNRLKKLGKSVLFYLAAARMLLEALTLKARSEPLYSRWWTRYSHAAPGDEQEQALREGHEDVSHP